MSVLNYLSLNCDLTTGGFLFKGQPLFVFSHSNVFGLKKKSNLCNNLGCGHPIASCPSKDLGYVTYLFPKACKMFTANMPIIELLK